MKIVFITTSSINGGAQKHMRDMFLEFYKKGHQIYLIAPRGWLTDELAEYESKIFHIDGKLIEYQKVAKMLAKIQPNIINTFLLSGGMLGYMAWKKKKIGKIFVTVNNSVIYEGIKPINRALYPMFYRYMSKGVQAFLVKSDKVRDEVETIICSRKPVLSIKNGIDFNVYNKNIEGIEFRKAMNIPADAIVITTTGALEGHKGQRYLIDAVISLHQEYDKVYCWIAGGGSLHDELETYIQGNFADEYIKLIGNRKDVPNVLAASDVYVLPSLHEGLPNSLMEAMAMGLACVATNVGGVKELISQDELGIVVEAKDCNAIYGAIKKILKNKEYAKRIGDNAYKKIKNCYGIDVVSEELENIYIWY